MTQLAHAVDAVDKLWTLDTLPPSPFVQVDDELVEISSTFPEQIYDPTQELRPPKIRVRRAVGGTTAAAHAEGVVLTPIYSASLHSGGFHQEIDIDYVDIEANVGIVELPGYIIEGPALVEARLVEMAPIEGVLSIDNTPDLDVWGLSDAWEASGDPDDESEAASITGDLLTLAPVQWLLDLGGATGGDFKLEVTTDAFGSTTEETAAINFDVSAANIAAALAFLTTVVSSEPEATFDIDLNILITLEGHIVGDNVTAFIISENNLTGGDPATLTEYIPEIVPPVMRPASTPSVLYLDAGETRRIGIRLKSSAQPTGGSVKVVIQLTSPNA